MISSQPAEPPRLTALPGTQRLFVGVDIAKRSHVAAFVNADLLGRHKRFTRCPTISFINSRAGFASLVEMMKGYAPLACCAVLMEHTGHYGLALQQYLQELDIDIYEIHASKRMSRDKTDKRDAQSLAYALYAQVSLGVQVLEETQRIYRSLPPSDTGAKLRVLARRRYELERDVTRRKNKLTATCDTLFPELTEIIKNPNNATALRIRTAYPTPTSMLSATHKELIASRGGGSLPSNANMAKLQELATTTIGTKNKGRIDALVVEQQQLIDELTMLNQHCDAIDAEIASAVTESREGKILTAIPGIGIDAAGQIIASIGSIVNFERTSKLRAYFGWAPVATQTGETKDSAALTKGGRRPMKKAMYLVAWRAIKDDTEFRAIYERLVKSRCAWDEKKQDYIGKNKIIGRICGQIIGMIWMFLKRDYDLLASLADGEEPPEPTVYSRAVHREHRLRRQSKEA